MVPRTSLAPQTRPRTNPMPFSLGHCRSR
uniref:Uncharacterized protein n=1 Tax=Arundo donax TaxID=35708 RepID=A0A0A9BU03_ARUDO